LVGWRERRAKKKKRKQITAELKNLSTNQTNNIWKHFD